jgi:hypothetical protein
VNGIEIQRALCEFARDGALALIDESCACMDRNVYDVSEVAAVADAGKVKRAVELLDAFGLIRRDEGDADIIHVERTGAGESKLPPLSLDPANKVLFDGQNRLLVIDGVKVSLDFLALCMRPDPRLLYSFRREGDVMGVKTRLDAEAMAGKPSSEAPDA